MSIFDFMYERYQPKKKIRLIELFAGVGSQYKALKEITKGTDYQVESYKICEWAVPSIKAYNSIHLKDFNNYSKDKTLDEMLAKVKMVSLNYDNPISETQLKRKGESWVRDVYNNIAATHNLVNIMEIKGSDLEIVDTDKYEYIMSYSFPCQDLSKAGKRGGLEVSQKDGGTRSGLLWEVERILNELDYEHRPNVLLMENVPDLIEVNFIKQWHKWLERLEELGYKTNVIDVLNAKDYGIPQNRKRVFCISIKGEYAYSMPYKQTLKHRLGDLLEKEADEKYFLTPEHIKRIESWKSYERPLENVMNEKSISSTIRTHVGKDSAEMKLVGFEDKDFVSKHYENYAKEHNGEIPEMFNPYNETKVEEVAPTQTTKCGSTTSSSTVLIKNNNKKGYAEAQQGDGIDISTRMQYHRGTVQKGLSQTLTCEGGNNVGIVVNGKSEWNKTHLRIRKLTPCECIKLMGFEKCDYEAMRDIDMTDMQIYHCAGDSIVVTVLMGFLANC